ncbi:MAG: ABC-type Fe3+-siderophore transport system permease subunit [Planctomycetota bacterium]|jgi:ABC-type Fe3+-siderophore transport system permease subunit
MNENSIEHIWQTAGEEGALSQEQLIAALQPRAAHAARDLRRQVWSYLLLQLGTLLLVGANLQGYWHNPLMRSIELGVGLAALAFAIHGVRLHGEVQHLDRMDQSFEAALQGRLAFYRSHADTWIWLAALSVVGFTFALNSMVDNVDGSYRINHPAIFAGVQVGMLLALVASFRLAYEPHLRQARAALADLEAQVLDRALHVDDGLKRLSRWKFVLAAVLTTSLVLGAWVALK